MRKSKDTEIKVAEYSETDLETRIINHLQEFIMELGKGFTYVDRQKRFTFDEDHFRVDLVMYNRLLRCFVLFDLKIGKLKHQDLGQMQMYVNYYDRYEKIEDENPTVGRRYLSLKSAGAYCALICVSEIEYTADG